MFLSEEEGLRRHATFVKFRSLCSQVPLWSKSVINDECRKIFFIGIELTNKRLFRNVWKSSEQSGLIFIEP